MTERAVDLLGYLSSECTGLENECISKLQPGIFSSNHFMIFLWGEPLRKEGLYFLRSVFYWDSELFLFLIFKPIRLKWKETLGLRL